MSTLGGMDIELEELDTADVRALVGGVARNVARVREQGGTWVNSRLYRAHMSRALKHLADAQESLREAQYWANDGSEVSVRDGQLELPFSEEVPF